MKKTPAIIWIITIILVLNGVQAILSAFNHNQILSTAYLWATASFIAAGGLIFGKGWSQYIVYLLAASTSLYWIYIIWRIYQSGWPHDDIQSTIISLVPGMLLLTVCTCSSIVVYKYFNKRVKT